MKKTYLAVFGVIALCTILAATLLLQPASRTLQQAVTNAVNFCKGLREPDALLMIDVMHRRFGIEVFAGALERYDEQVSSHTDDVSMLRIFRRIADYYNPLQEGDLQAVYAETDRITVPALYCDRLALPPNYPAMLEDASRRGGYMLTHVLLALTWLRENDGDVSLPDGFKQDVFRKNAALINDDNVVTDLELEAAAFLYLMGQDALVNSGFVEKVVAVQNLDGGWRLSSAESDVSNWHPTVLALFFLLHVENPASSYPPMLAPASG
jgi:hypothetical protein